MRAASAVVTLAAVTCLAGCAHGQADGGARALAGLSYHLEGLDGAPYSLEEAWRTHDAVALIWWATGCTCVRRYQARMEALRAIFPEPRVAILAISSNADDSVEDLRRVAGERGFALPLLVDRGGALAALLAVRTTPTAVLLDRDGHVRFKGWIDNERAPGESGRIPYLEEAIGGLLNGKEGFAVSSRTFGCLITRSVGEVGQCEDASPP